MAKNVTYTHKFAPSWIVRGAIITVTCAWLAACSCSGTASGDPCTKDGDCNSGFCELPKGVCVPPEDLVDGAPPCRPDKDLCMCADQCESTGPGQGGGNFDPGTHESSGVGTNPNGELILDSKQIAAHIIWIANTQQGTVAKIDTRTFEELGRYQTGPNGPVSQFYQGNDPSRTSVNTFSDVYVGNRADGSVIKISALGANCPDRNGDGVITTSTGPTDIKPWMGGEPTDECILWHTTLPSNPGLIRAVAAQDIPGPDGTLVSYVWAGGWGDRVYKLDGDTGAVLIDTPGPARPYGFALDGAGNLWLASREDTAGIARIDTTRCIDTASCNVTTCGGDMQEAGDDCIKQFIPIPTGGEYYGITVDMNQRVWVGGQDATVYDPALPWAQRFTPIKLADKNIENSMGIAASRDFVYLAYDKGGGYGNGPIVQVDIDDPTKSAIIDGTAGSTYGLAIDLDGKVWGIPKGQTGSPVSPVVFTPSKTLGNVTIAPNPPGGLIGPYTYSDMTGSQLRLATNPRGYYRETYEGCEEENLWGSLYFDVETPAGTHVYFVVRTADTKAGLATAEKVTVAMVPSDMSPVSVASALAAAGVQSGRFLELEVQLVTEVVNSDTAITPTVKAFAVSHTCSITPG